jgi:hypothetical protein
LFPNRELAPRIPQQSPAAWRIELSRSALRVSKVLFAEDNGK